MTGRENILVTGGGSGIGRAVAVRMAKEMTVVVADWNEDGAVETVAEIEKAGGAAIAIKTDVSDSASVGAMKDRIAREVGPLSRAFLGAGIFIKGVVGQIPEEDWDRMIDIHVKGTFLCAQAALPDMVAAKRGAIVTMSSDFAVMAVPGAAAYMAAKSAIYSLTKCLALEFAPNIRINALGPGPIDTPILKSNRTPEEYEKALGTLAESLPIGRLGRPEEVAAVADFLLSDRASYMTGQIVHPNGGQLMW